MLWLLSVCEAIFYENAECLHLVIFKLKCIQLFTFNLQPVFSSFQSPRTRWAPACSSFYGSIFPGLFYCHWQTIKVCWTHACCPSAGCGSIKASFCEKQVAVQSKKRRAEAVRKSITNQGLAGPYKLGKPTMPHLSRGPFDLEILQKCSSLPLLFCVTRKLSKNDS